MDHLDDKIEVDKLTWYLLWFNLVANLVYYLFIK